MPKSHPVRVLIVDNDRTVVQRLTDELAKLGYHVKSPDGAGDALLGNTRDLAPHFRPHVVILDLCLVPGSSEDYLGIDLLEQYEPLKSARIVPYSSYLTPEATARLYALRVEPWVSKGASPRTLLDAVDRAAQLSAASRSTAEIEPTAAWDPATLGTTVTDDPTIPSDLAADVLCRLFPRARRLTVGQLSASVVSSQTSVRGHSVLRTVVEDGRVPVVVKWARSGKIRCEWDNYDRYVRGRLGGLYYPQAESHAEFWDLGAIVYAFLAAEQQQFDSFSGWYEQDNTVAQTAAPLTHLFRDLWGGHYMGDSIECRNLFDAYDAILNLRLHLGGMQGRSVPPAVRALAQDLADPLVWVSQYRAESSVPGARQVITHGDLHADNFFVDESHAWPIDFERTGLGPRLRDFAELEVDIVTRLVPPLTADAPPEQDLPWFLPLALAVAGAPAPTGGIPAYAAISCDLRLSKARGVLNEIRKLAFEMTHYAFMREYLWNLLLDTAWVICHADMTSLRYHRAFLLGAILCQRLHRPNRTWPPRSFKAACQSSSSSPRRSRSTRPSRKRPPTKKHVFLSHHRGDLDIVSEIGQRLQTTQDIPVWLDSWDLLGGDPWQEKLEKALRQSRACVVFWGPHGAGRWQSEEMRIVLAQRVRDPTYRVIPVLLPGARRPRARLPAFLQRLQWVDMHSGLDDDSFNDLVAGITGRRGEAEDAQDGQPD